jgi:hypothetical protein
MCMKSNIYGMNEAQIKSFFKQSIMNGTYKRVLKSRTLKSSKYLQKIAKESSNELEEMTKNLETTIDCPTKRWKYLVKNI